MNTATPNTIKIHLTHIDALAVSSLVREEETWVPTYNGLIIISTHQASNITSPQSCLPGRSLPWSFFRDFFISHSVVEMKQT